MQRNQCDSSLISVIVPIYNSEEYIRDCVNSILAQRDVDIEVLLIDDGSTDHTPDLCKELCALNHNVRYYAKPNGGVSSARNYGLDRCTGNYVTFVDSDDKVPAESFRSLLDAFTDEVDLTCCSVDNVDSSGTVIDVSFQCRSKRVFSGLEAMYECLRPGGSIGFTVYAKLFRTFLFNDGDRIRFPEGRLMEEAFILPSIFSKCRVVIHIDRSGYRYLVSRPDSYTSKPLCKDCFAVYETASRFRDELPRLFPGLSLSAINSWDFSNRINLYRTALREEQVMDSRVFQKVKSEFMETIPAVFISQDVPLKNKALALDTFTKFYLIREHFFNGVK